MNYKNILASAFLVLTLMVPVISRAADPVPTVAPPLGTTVSTPQSLAEGQTARPLPGHGGKPGQQKADQGGYTPPKYSDKPYEGKVVVDLDSQASEKPHRLFSVK